MNLNFNNCRAVPCAHEGDFNNTHPFEIPKFFVDAGCDFSKEDYYGVIRAFRNNMKLTIYFIRHSISIRILNEYPSIIPDIIKNLWRNKCFTL